MFDLGHLKSKAMFHVTTTFFGTSFVFASMQNIDAPKLVWNASQSVPAGLYKIIDEAPARGDLVLARLPKWAAFLANQRGYLPNHTPVLKHLSAVQGDIVCRFFNRIYVNHMPVAIALESDHAARRMPRWQGCKRLQQGEIFLQAGHPYSFDGRYFGITKISSIIGIAQPLWLIAD